jgi:hypothetical protein
MIHGEGIMPDIIVENMIIHREVDIFDEIDQMQPLPKSKEEKIPYDDQLARAIDLLKGIDVYKNYLHQQCPINEDEQKKS